MVKRHGVTDFLTAFTDATATFFDVESDLLVVLDEHGDIERVNPAWERMLNRPEKDCIGRPIIVFVFHEDFARFMRAFQNVTRSEPFRLLHYEHGVVTVRLVAYRFKRMVEYQRGFLVMRPIRE